MSTTAKPRPATKLAPLSPQDALDMLTSAIGYVRQAGLVVRAGNNAGKLVLAIEGAEVVNAGNVTRFAVLAPQTMLANSDAGTPVLANPDESAGK